MRRVADLIEIALRAIWANKLRSFLTTLGNIVSVGSIIAVVSLIQGINTEVTGLIVSRLGSDSFTIERVGLVMSADELEAARNNPRLSLDDAAAIRRFSTHLGAIMAEASRTGEVRYRGRTLESVQIRGVTRDYLEFPAFTAELGRLINRPRSTGTARSPCLAGTRRTGSSVKRIRSTARSRSRVSTSASSA